MNERAAAKWEEVGLRRLRLRRAAARCQYFPPPIKPLLSGLFDHTLTGSQVAASDPLSEWNTGASAAPRRPDSEEERGGDPRGADDEEGMKMKPAGGDSSPPPASDTTAVW